jgi:hypothetical protein
MARIIFPHQTLLELGKSDTNLPVPCIGIRPHPADTHIWGPLARAPGTILFIGDRAQFDKWATANRPGSAKWLAPRFATGYLKPDDKEAITKWLGERCGQMRCFCCGHSRWQLLDESSIQIGFDTHTSRFHSHSFFTCSHFAPLWFILIMSTGGPTESGAALIAASIAFLIHSKVSSDGI